MRSVRLGAALLLFASAATAQTIAREPDVGPVDAFESVQRLSADILASRSATAVLETWCRDHRLADPATIVAHVIEGARKRPSAEQLRRLGVDDERDVAYRHVRLECGAHVLSEADNWYVPARLTPEMNRVLTTTDTPFGRAVAALAPSRHTLAVRMLWSDSNRPLPDALFEHRAVLYTRDARPFCEVAEVYRRELLGFQVSAVAEAAQRDIRAARAAQNDAIASNDLDRAATFWTEDVTVRRALGQALSGRAAARQALAPPQAPARRIVYRRLTAAVEAGAQWPLAFETGTWEGHLDSADGPVVVGGRFSAQWVKRSGGWLIRSEVFVALTCAGVGCEAAAVP